MAALLECKNKVGFFLGRFGNTPQGRLGMIWLFLSPMHNLIRRSQKVILEPFIMVTAGVHAALPATA